MNAVLYNGYAQRLKSQTTQGIYMEQFSVT